MEFPAVLTRVQAKPVDIIKEAILMNSKIDCNPIIIADRPNPKPLGRTISCLLPVDKLGQLQIWARRNNAKKLALFTESLSFWTTKKIDPTVFTPKIDADQQVAASIITAMLVAVAVLVAVLVVLGRLDNPILVMALPLAVLAFLMTSLV